MILSFSALSAALKRITAAPVGCRGGDVFGRGNPRGGVKDGGRVNEGISFVLLSVKILARCENFGARNFIPLQRPGVWKRENVLVPHAWLGAEAE